MIVTGSEDGLVTQIISGNQTTKSQSNLVFMVQNTASKL
jgi:hypothetical protein